MSKKINIIACIAKNGAIGYNNQLLYHLQADMEHFKALTMGHTIIMGRKTYESLPNGALPHRLNVVVSRHLQHIEGCKVYPSLEEALATTDELYIIGGSSIYEATLPLANHLYITLVEDEPKEADTFFPSINWAEWSIASKTEKKEQGLSFTILALDRIIS